MNVHDRTSTAAVGLDIVLVRVRRDPALKRQVEEREQMRGARRPTRHFRPAWMEWRFRTEAADQRQDLGCRRCQAVLKDLSITLASLLGKLVRQVMRLLETEVPMSLPAISHQPVT